MVSGPLLPTIKTSVPQINILSHNSKSLKHTITKTVGQSALNHPPLEIKISKEINAKDGKWQGEAPRCRWYRNGDRISTYCFPLCSRFPIYNSSSLKAVIILNCRQEKGIFRKQSRAKFSHFGLIHFLRYTKANLTPTNQQASTFEDSSHLLGALYTLFPEMWSYLLFLLIKGRSGGSPVSDYLSFRNWALNLLQEKRNYNIAKTSIIYRSPRQVESIFHQSCSFEDFYRSHLFLDTESKNTSEKHTDRAHTRSIMKKLNFFGRLNCQEYQNPPENEPLINLQPSKITLNRSGEHICRLKTYLYLIGVYRLLWGISRF